MKKLSLLIALIVIIATPAISQDEGGTTASGISFGVKAGVNFASVNGDIADDEEWDGRTGFHGGVLVNIPVTELFSVQPELLYSTQGFKFTDVEDNEEVTGKLDYIIIPVLADFSLAEGFSLQGGPQIGFNVTKELEADGYSMDIEESDEVDEVKSIEFAATIGAQYRLPMGLFFQARYTIGFTDIIETNPNYEFDMDTSLKNSVFSISAGWFFN
jgi:hypothetical protein